MIAVVLAMLLAVSALVAALFREEDRFDEGTPERAVQEYLKAVEDKDATAAFSFLSPALVARCGSPPREAVTQRGSAAIRAVLEKTVPRGATAAVHVSLTETFRDTPFVASDTDQSLVFELAQVEGEWEFAEMPWPFSYYCPSFGKPIGQPTAIPSN